MPDSWPRPCSAGRTNLLTKTPLPKPPAVLEQKAQDVIQSLGYTEPPTDRAYGFLYATEYQSYAEKHEKPATYEAQLAKGQPPLIYFWYRQSSQYLEAAPTDRPNYGVSVVSPTNPPPTHSGMINLNLDAQGRLIELSAVPPQVEETPASPRPMDSRTALLTAAWPGHVSLHAGRATLDTFGEFRRPGGVGRLIRARTGGDDAR